MIGYNAEKINDLIKSLCDSYAKLGETMATGWDNVSTTLGTEWVGPDEVSFETELANRMCQLYYACKESVNGMVSNVRMLGMAWQEFQNANMIQGAVSTQTVSFELATVSLPDYAIEQKVKAAERTFTVGQKMGVTNGTESATAINTSITNYVNEIGKNVKEMYTTTSTAEAFLGASQSDAIHEYLTKMAHSFAQVTTQVSDLQTTMDKLVKNYNEQMANFTKQVSGLDTSVGGTTE